MTFSNSFFINVKELIDEWGKNPELQDLHNISS